MRRTVLFLSCALLVACGGESMRSRDAGVPRDDAGQTTPDSGDPRPDGGPGCVDDDEDGYGEGCALGPDCNDTAATVSPAATETCNGVDDDCDGTADDGVGAPSCALTEGVCAGATARCGPEGFLECDATDYGADYEADETLCDSLDNDCDGTTDEGCTCTEGATQSCGSDTGACAAGTQTCTDGAWGACDGEVGPMGETCNGADDDCDGASDEPSDLTPPDCPLQLGVCAGSRRACGGASGWIACSGTTSYGGDYEAVETLCDTLDNDCDGVADEGCECVDGATQACGSDIGACMAGTQTCVAGAWGASAGDVASMAESCNGGDDDCDGRTDEGVVGPACALAVGVCAGSMQRCGGAGGFVACTATDYGPDYQATETRCDGQDNDCDGMLDEGCACVDGATQACGLATGACERGTQTCSGGAWGACTGGVDPVTELCNGLDDDCDGVSDDGLTPPPCALSMGVCAGSRQTCGGASGWQACAGTASYGPRYLATEDGSADESACDGLDNDCNGTVDDGCTSGPLVSGPEDTVFPDLYNRHLVYSVNFDGNWDLVFRNLDRGTTQRLTTTAADETGARISGNYVAFVRGVDAGARAVLYDLVAGTETVLSTRQTGSVSIAGPFVAWDEVNGTQWDVVVYDITDGSRTTIGASTTDEFTPVVRGGRLAYVGTSTGAALLHVAPYDIDAGTWGAPTVQTGSGAGGGHQSPGLDFIGLAWTDGRAITGTPTLTSDWDVYGAPFTAAGSLVAWPGENAIETSTGAQIVRDMDSQIIVWDDQRSGNWDVGVVLLGGAPLLATSSAATQAGPAVSGSHIVWYDNRLGSYDIYESFYVGATFAPGVGTIVVSEVLADPAAAADPNGDGTASTTNDEFVEIINLAGQAVNISGMTLSDATGVRHTFPPGTIVPSLGLVVVFAGGTPTGLFGGAIVQTASSGTLGLNNGGDTLTLRSGTTVIDTVTYGSEGGNDQSIVRDDTSWVLHSSLPTSIGPYSPGLYADGFVP